MVKRAEKQYVLPDGSINLEVWLDNMRQTRDAEAIAKIRQACVLSQLAGEKKYFLGETDCFHHGLKMAERLDEIGVDSDAIASAVMFPTIEYAGFPLEDVHEQLGENVAKIIEGVIKMDIIRNMEQANTKKITKSHIHIDNVRKMLLAMIDDVRVVLIKLVERVCLLHAALKSGLEQQVFLANETLDIFAPLASRLGIGGLKWELEDLSFRILHPDKYKELAKMISERRVDRDRYIKDFIVTLQDEFKKAGIEKSQISGRAKHIYSIFKKMNRKNVSFDQIFDVRAVRVLVPSIEDCYAVLGVVHGQWTHIQEEFDDYITAPKPNGYRSIHTAVIGPNDKHIEVQIRTQEMHDESELGVAAHWMYKEGPQKSSSIKDKILWLRQVMDWQHELSSQGGIFEPFTNEIFEDRVYVFTPNGEIKDLQIGATVLDFAYHVHSEVGHRCRGAKINDSIVPLTHALETGDRVEILTAKQPNPSRDWLNPHLGYLATSRAKAKLHHWFKVQDYDKNLADGQQTLERDLKRVQLKLSDINLNLIADHLNFKSSDDLLASIGAGDTRSAQIINYIRLTQLEQKPEETGEPKIKSKSPIRKKLQDEILVEGLHHFATNVARCCKPVPGDTIIGYITKDRGISIHRKDCKNLQSPHHDLERKLIKVTWGETAGNYSVDIFIKAYNHQGLINDLTSILSTEKVNLIGLNTSHDKAESIYYTNLTIEISNSQQLTKIIERIKQLSNVVAVERLSGN